MHFLPSPFNSRFLRSRHFFQSRLIQVHSVPLAMAQPSAKVRLGPLLSSMYDRTSIEFSFGGPILAFFARVEIPFVGSDQSVRAWAVGAGAPRSRPSVLRSSSRSGQWRP